MAALMAVAQFAAGELTLRGRRDECARLDGLLEGAMAGRSAVLTVTGEAGVGKTALLKYAITSASASGLRIVRVAGIESEMELAYAGLHQLCAPLLDRLERLPAPQRDALGTTFGQAVGSVPDRFFVGLAVLGLLSETAEERPLLCVVDDAQWLDRASALALAFVARRLLAEPVAMLFAAREPGDEFGGLPELLIEGLEDGDARALLASVIPGRLDERVVDQVLAETRGNPLALLELPRGLSADQLAGGFGLPGALSLQGRIEETFVARLDALPEGTRRLLLVAAAEPTGDPGLLWQAADRLGITDPALEPAESAGLIEVGERVRFRHPLVRSAVYLAATPPERRQAHRALAESTDAQADPDRRAWHLAEATDAPDESIAAELERAAARAQARGGLAAAAAFLERAARLTVQPAARVDRTLAAAGAKQTAGASDAALALVATVEAEPLDELQRARVDLLRGQIAFALDRGRDAPALLLRAAERIKPLDPTLARETYLDALSAATFAGRLSGRVGLLEVARAARAAPSPPQPGRAADLLLDGLALVITEGWAAGTSTLKDALSAFRSGTPDTALRWPWLAGLAALDVWDDESWHELAARHVRLARDSGALAVLPIALNTRIGVHLGAGEIAAAQELLEESKTVSEATGSRLAPYNAVAVAAYEGREAEVSRLIEATGNEILSRGEGISLTLNHWATAVLYNGLGRYAEALSAAEAASEHPYDLRFFTRALVELIEAASRTGYVARARHALEQLSESTQASGTDVALGMEARSRALLSEGDAAEVLYREAITRLARTRLRVHLGRAHLLYGEWLRRERRRREAREQLRTALDMFTSMGTAALADRASRELMATGEHARKRSAATRDDLTPQEAQIARLARDGLSNAEIGARLFLSESTIAYHLRNVFSKLNLSSRHELAHVLPDVLNKR
jgi:DNA-binding CsgD family transcriptional regulator/molybdopterin-guanine dinucleotide biosynthesis protein